MYSVAIDEGVWMASYTSCAAQTAPIHYRSTIGEMCMGGLHWRASMIVGFIPAFSRKEYFVAILYTGKNVTFY